MLDVPHVRLRLHDTTVPWISNFLHSHPRYFLLDSLGVPPVAPRASGSCTGSGGVSLPCPPSASGSQSVSVSNPGKAIDTRYRFPIPIATLTTDGKSYQVAWFPIRKRGTLPIFFFYHSFPSRTAHSENMGSGARLTSACRLPIPPPGLTESIMVSNNHMHKSASPSRGRCACRSALRAVRCGISHRYP